MEIGMAYGELNDCLHPWREPVAGPFDWLVAGVGALSALLVGWPLGGVPGLIIVGLLAAGLALRVRGIAVARRVVLTLRWLGRKARIIDTTATAAEQHERPALHTLDGAPLLTRNNTA